MNNNNLNLRYQPEFNQYGRILNPLQITQDAPHIVSTVIKIHNQIFPHLRDNTYPINYINGVKSIYQQLKSLRASQQTLTIGKEMHGLNKTLICAIAFHSIMNDEMTKIPTSMFVSLLNDKNITLTKFEKVKKDQKIGLHFLFLRSNPNYLSQKTPSFYLNNYLKNILNIPDSNFEKIKNTIKSIEKNNIFNEFTNPVHILYATILIHFPNVSTSKFGINTSKFKKIKNNISKYT